MRPPLADLLRPQALNEVVGQDHLVGPQGFLTKLIETKSCLSIILWGPPGCGKTTIGRLYAKAFEARFVSMSGVFGSISDLKKLVQDTMPTLFERTVLFVDEIHRFNRAQQDAFLPYVETGALTLIGATTENPSLNLNSALLSRLRVLQLHVLGEEQLLRLIKKYEETQRELPLDESARKLLVEMAQGDGRYLFNLLENLQALGSDPLNADALKEYLQSRPAHYDKAGDGHYNAISALHKAVRGSDVDAALYWLCRMLAGGEDPLFICRRIIRMASEDVGLADPGALEQAHLAERSYRLLGSPEGELVIAQAIVYMALAPKSNAIYTAYGSAKELAEKTTHLRPPLHAINAPTRLMKEQGFGRGYAYDHDVPSGCAGQNYFPQELERTSLYHPTSRGFEKELQKRLEYFQAEREKHVF